MKKCRVCGGRLTNGTCKKCGYTEDKYEENVEYDAYEINNEQQVNFEVQKDSIEKLRNSLSDIGKQDKQNNTILKQKFDSNVNNSKKSKSKAIISRIWIIIFIGMIAFGIYSYFSGIESDVKIEKIEGTDEVIKHIDVSMGDTYSNLEITPKEIGDNYSTTLTAGFYEVGVHIPEGSYTVSTLCPEYSRFRAFDSANSFSFNNYQDNCLKEDYKVDENLQKIVFDNLYLFEGSKIEINTSSLVEGSSPGVTLVTENAQLDSVKGNTPNKKIDKITISEGGTVFSGIDFPAGTYDILLKVKGSDYDSVEIDGNDSLDDKTLSTRDKFYKNVEVTKGSKITTDIEIELTTSEFNTIEEESSYID